MSRRIKQLVESDLKARYGDLREAVVVNLIGLTGTDNNKLRRVLRAKKLQMHVVPNRAFRRAIGDATPAAGQGAEWALRHRERRGFGD